MKQFKKISVDEEIHEELKTDKFNLRLKSLSDVIRYYKYGKKKKV